MFTAEDYFGIDTFFTSMFIILPLQKFTTFLKIIKCIYFVSILPNIISKYSNEYYIVCDVLICFLCSANNIASLPPWHWCHYQKYQNINIRFNNDNKIINITLCQADVIDLVDDYYMDQYHTTINDTKNQEFYTIGTNDTKNHQNNPDYNALIAIHPKDERCGDGDE